jgi:hypothetical protein
VLFPGAISSNAKQGFLLWHDVNVGVSIISTIKVDLPGMNFILRADAGENAVNQANVR